MERYIADFAREGFKPTEPELRATTLYLDEFEIQYYTEAWTIYTYYVMMWDLDIYNRDTIAINLAIL